MEAVLKREGSAGRSGGPSVLKREGSGGRIGGGPNVKRVVDGAAKKVANALRKIGNVGHRKNRASYDDEDWMDTDVQKYLDMKARQGSTPLSLSKRPVEASFIVSKMNSKDSNHERSSSFSGSRLSDVVRLSDADKNLSNTAKNDSLSDYIPPRYLPMDASDLDTDSDTESVVNHQPTQSEPVDQAPAVVAEPARDDAHSSGDEGSEESEYEESLSGDENFCGNSELFLLNESLGNPLDRIERVIADCLKFQFHVPSGLNSKAETSFETRETVLQAENEKNMDELTLIESINRMLESDECEREIMIGHEDFGENKESKEYQLSTEEIMECVDDLLSSIASESEAELEEDIADETVMSISTESVLMEREVGISLYHRLSDRDNNRSDLIVEFPNALMLGDGNISSPLSAGSSSKLFINAPEMLRAFESYDRMSVLALAQLFDEVCPQYRREAVSVMKRVPELARMIEEREFQSKQERNQYKNRKYIANENYQPGNFIAQQRQTFEFTSNTPLITL
uniref:Uncharacterized protein n=1 Tax=Timspurckia oligopyrenoides TaxID=708627 RepID=A0A7S0ZCE2_9RHOD